MSYSDLMPTRSVVSALVLVAVAGACSSSGSSSAAGAGGQPSPGDRVRLMEPSQALLQAFSQTDLLAESMKPLGVNQMVFQRLPAKSDTLGVLFVDTAPTLPGVLPLDEAGPFCQLVESRSLGSVDVCDHTGACARPQVDDAPVLLCHGPSFQALEDVLYGFHDPDKMAPIIASDWAFAGYMRELERDRQAARARFSPMVEKEHEAMHLTFALYFTIARAAVPLGARVRGEPFTMDAPPLDDVAQGHARVCQHYSAFLRHDLIPDFGIPIEPEDEADKAMAARLDPLWRAEIEADDAGAYVLGQITASLSDTPADASSLLGEMVIQTLTAWTLYDWYRRVGQFADEHCQAEASKSFFVSRCFCRDRERYLATSELYDPRLPPAYLRLTRAVAVSVQTSGIMDELDEAGQQATNLRLLFLQNLSEVPGKVAVGACLIGASPEEGGKLAFPSMPALDGFMGESDEEFWGAPPPDLQAEITAYCAAD